VPKQLSAAVLWQALAFVLVGLLLHGVAFGAYRAVVEPAHRVTQSDQEFLASSEPLDLLVVGGSHARNAIEPRRLGRAHSIAVGGEHYLKSMYRVPWLLDASQREVATAIVSFDVTGLSSWKADHFAPEFIWGRYVDFFALGLRRGMPWEYGKKWVKAHLVPYAGERATLAQRLQGERAFKQPGAGRDAALPAVSERRNGLEIASYHFEGYVAEDPHMAWGFRQLVGELRARGIRVVMVTFPVTPGYSLRSRELGADGPMRQQLLDELVVPGVVDHLDFEAAFHREPSFFYDGDHVNGRGRRRFTRMLRSELLRLGVL